MPTKAIVIAAGMGKRLRPFTDEMPKCLVPVGGQPILTRQLAAFRRAGVTDVVVIRGYKADVLEARRGELGPGVRFVENRDYEQNNILESLSMAAAELDGPVYTTYADIVFAPEVVTELRDTAGDIVLVVDQAFRDIYVGRSEHPLPEAEVATLDPTGGIAQVGKRAVTPEEAFGEFIGLMRLSAAGAKILRQVHRELADRYANRQGEPFQRAKTWRQAYLTDLLQYMIEAGVRLLPCTIQGRWREIDTTQDLERAATAPWLGEAV